jgi:colanic acid biosynthesis glycosyl transferase WcaI
MHRDDLNEVVRLHIRSFPEFFLTSLGDGFLFELYSDFMKESSSICKVIEYEGQINGFTVGSLNPGGFFKKMLWQRWYFYLFYARKALFKNPVSVSRKLLFAIQYRGERPQKLSNAALLSSIVVNPDMSNSGFGSKLIRAFCQEAFLRGADAVYLITDKFNNDPVNTFYIKNGFQLESTFEKTRGRMMNRYILIKDEKII